MALVQRERHDRVTLLWRAIVAIDDIAARMEEAIAKAVPKMIVIGSGTGSRPVAGIVREAHPGFGILIIDETDTSIQARERYWEHHPRRGWRRLLPSTLQVPPEPIDDFAAMVLAERVLLV
jgi:hypothetical protein